MNMDILQNGTRVRIIEADMKATVIAVIMSGIDAQFIEYKLRFWVAGERKTEWVFPDEVEVYVDNSKKAGMVNYEEDTSKLIT